MLLKNKKTLITGGSSGIGKAIAISFIKNGADVAIFVTNKQRAEEAIKEMDAYKVNDSQQIFYKIVDVSKTKDVEEAVKEVFQVFKEIDVLVNNAGITKDGFIIKMTEDDWDRVIDVNLKSIFNTCKVVSRQMMRAKRGKIINISSVVALMGNPSQVNYAASKAGMIGFTKSLAKELSRRNVCVNCIAPGYIQTKMTGDLPDDVKEKMLSNIPLNRFGDPKDIANAVLFLASNMSDYITGQVLTVDGGMVM
jgi:3-oxoacyl-[acyl-carrier protein] reductase